MNSLGKSARGAIILVLALVIGTWIISRTSNAPVAAASSSSSEETTSTVVIETIPTTILPPRAPKSVRVLMVNGTTTTGIAKKARNCVLETYDALSPTNTKIKPSESALYAEPGYETEARQIAAILNIQLEPLPFPATTDLVVEPNPRPNVMLTIGDSVADTIRNLPCAVNVVPS